MFSTILRECSENKSTGLKQSSQIKSQARNSLTLFENDEKSNQNQNDGDSSFESIENEQEIALNAQKAQEIIDISSSTSIESIDRSKNEPSTSKLVKPKTARKPDNIRKPLGTFNRPLNHDKDKEDYERLTTRQLRKRGKGPEKTTPIKKAKK